MKCRAKEISLMKHREKKIGNAEELIRSCEKNLSFKQNLKKRMEQRQSFKKCWLRTFQKDTKPQKPEAYYISSRINKKNYT